jgi:hypothetical protein
MEPELERHLHNASHEQLLLVLLELAARHPALQTEMIDILENEAGALQSAADEGEDVELNGDSEDWDFSGDELEPMRPVPLPVLLPLDREAYQQRIQGYAVRLTQGESLQGIKDDLTELLEEAETRAEHHDYQAALDLYGLVLDERLANHNNALSQLFDSAIDEAMPVLETLLSETSNNILLDPSEAFSPLLPSVMRQRWLERLFALWLKRLDVRRVEENIPELLLNIAWSEDIPLLRTLVQNELSRHPKSVHTNIVDFTLSHRIRTLEKFLKELPRM